MHLLCFLNQWISWFVNTIMCNLDFSFKSWFHLTHCVLNILWYFVPWVYFWNIWDISISFSPCLFSYPHIFMALGILCELLKWTLTFGTSQSPRLFTQHCTLRKWFFNYCHYFLPQPSQPPRTLQIICSAEGKFDIFSSTITGGK